MENKNIICNKQKILAGIPNAKIFLDIENEYPSFSQYLLSFARKKILIEKGKMSDSLSDRISSDLKKRGMKFVDKKIIYSYLEPIGLIGSTEASYYLANRGNKGSPSY